MYRNEHVIYSCLYVDSQVVENKNHCDTNDLVLDGDLVVPDNVASGSFDAPEVNSFGHTFRFGFFFKVSNECLLFLNINEWEFTSFYLFNRDYEVESERKKQVEEFYRMNHINQTYDFVSITI